MKRRTKILGGVTGVIVLVISAVLYVTTVDFHGPTQVRPPEPPRQVPPPVSDNFGAIDRILENLELGNIAFNVPGAMNLHDTATIQLVLGLEKSIDELKHMIEAEGEREGARIRVSESMEARLSGPGFSIAAITPERQAVSRSATTEWKWEIAANRAGNQSLHLTLSALLSVDGSPTPRPIRTFDKVIDVEVTWRQRMGSFWEEHWEWLWAALLVPLAGWLWKRRKRAKSDAT